MKKGHKLFWKLALLFCHVFLFLGYTWMYVAQRNIFDLILALGWMLLTVLVIVGWIKEETHD